MPKTRLATVWMSGRNGFILTIRQINSAALQAYFDDKTPTYTCEYRLGCKDGSWKWILVRGMVVNRTTDGKPLRMIGTQQSPRASRRKRRCSRRGPCRRRFSIAPISRVSPPTRRASFRSSTSAPSECWATWPPT